VVEQVVEITGQTQPLLDHRHARQLATGGIHLTQRTRQPSKADHIKTQPAHQQHQRNDMQPIGCANTPTEAVTMYV
jgi:hypothetical protein